MAKVKKGTTSVTKKTLAVAGSGLKKVKKTVMKAQKVSKAISDTTRHVLQMKKERKERNLKKLVADRGVVLVRHIPHGFYERELFEYFKQFGTVTSIKLPRSKNGISRGYAFVEFELKEVAKIAADTMHNYLMFGKLVKTVYIPPEKQKPNLFHRACMPWKDSTYKEATKSRRELDVERKNNPKVTGAQFAKKADRKIKAMQKRLLKKTGISYEFQINDPNQDTVKLISVKKQSPIKGKLTTKKEAKEAAQLDESDALLQVQSAPSALTKVLRSSKSKLRTVKSSALLVKDRLKTEAQTNQDVKRLKSKIKKVKNNVVNECKSVKNAAKSRATISKVKSGKVLKTIVNQKPKGKK